MRHIKYETKKKSFLGNQEHNTRTNDDRNIPDDEKERFCVYI